MGRKLRETRQPVSQSERPAGSFWCAMRNSMTERINDDESWVIGVLEPTLLLLLIAVIGAFLELL